MKKIIISSCVFLMILGMAMTASADTIFYSTTGYFQDSIGQQDPYTTGFDILTINAVVNSGPFSVSDVAQTYSLQALTFTAGINSVYPHTSDEYTASWQMTVNGTSTQTLSQNYTVSIDYSDTLHLELSASSVYFDLGSGNYLKVDLLAQNIINGGGTIEGNVMATMQVVPASSVPVPAAAWLLGSGLIGLLGFKRRRMVG